MGLVKVLMQSLCEQHQQSSNGRCHQVQLRRQRVRVTVEEKRQIVNSSDNNTEICCSYGNHSYSHRELELGHTQTGNMGEYCCYCCLYMRTCGHPST